jgi:predicted component of type VI protein secretion system
MVLPKTSEGFKVARQRASGQTGARRCGKFSCGVARSISRKQTMQVVLVMFRADGERRSFSVVRDVTVIGRREDCDLRIPLGDVSRKHCRLIKEAEVIRVEDLGSSNGTFHNNLRVQEATLGPGDTVTIGPVTFMVQIDGIPRDEDMQPAAATEEPAKEFFPVEEPAQAHLAASAQTTAEDGMDFDPKAQGEESIDDIVEFDFEDEAPPAKDRPASP